MTLTHADLPYRPCVGIMLLNAHGDVFTARRIDTLVEAWQMPQGGIDEGEDAQAAAFRELEEEIGTADAEVIDVTTDWLTYDLPDHLLGKVWKGRYRGQKQRWFVMRFRGSDQDINIDTEHPEFAEWRWQPMKALPQMIVPFKRALYEDLVRRFGHYGAG
ncbi:MAG: RNA pyrophosphohydrolase [Pseudomonadota bacterium]